MSTYVFGSTGGLGKVLADGLDAIAVAGRKECDVNFENSIASWFTTRTFANEPLHIVYAAGVSRSATLGRTKPADLWEEYAVNVLGPIRILHHALPLWKDRPLSSFTILGSVTAQTGVVGTIGYSSSKSALHGLVRVAAKELGRYQCRANVLELGYFDGGLIRQVPSEVLVNTILPGVPLRRLGTMEELVHAVRFAIENTFLNGAVVALNGGLV